MTKKNKIIYGSLLGLIVVTFLLVVTASAFNFNFLNIGTGCFPDDPSQDRLCPFNSNWGANSILLSWQVNLKPSKNSFCWLSCFYENGNSCPGYFKIDDKGIAKGSSAVGKNILPRDSAIIREPKVGQIYRANCVDIKDDKTEELKNKTTQQLDNLVLSAKANLIFASSTKMSIIADNSCERPFSTIVGNLKTGTIPTIVTEKNFSSWSNKEPQDNTRDSFGAGSGDFIDLKSYIEVNQLDNCSIENDSYFFESKKIEDIIANNFKKGFPFKIFLSSYPCNSTSEFSHAVVALDFNKTLRATSSDFTTGKIIGSGRDYDIKILDPNGPKVETIKCQTFDVRQESGDFFECKFKFLREGEPIKSCLILTPKIVSDVSGWKNLRDRYCVGDKKNDSLCKRNVSEFLEKDYPNIDNPAPRGSDGSCAGWQDFVLQIAYLGRFTDKDFHVGDLMGITCDQNYNPK